VGLFINALILWALTPVISRGLDVSFTPTYLQTVALLFATKMILPSATTYYYLKGILEILEGKTFVANRK
jgi:hypothetical protein